MNISEYLLDPSLNPPKEIEYYLNGNCDIFSIAANEVFGWDIYSILENRFLTDIGFVGVGLIHSFNCSSDKVDKIFDAKGIRSVDEINEEYLLPIDAWIAQVTKEELISIVHNTAHNLQEPFSRKTIDEMINVAAKFIEKYYKHFKV